jgi:trimeric autotransporter adhesin
MKKNIYAFLFMLVVTISGISAQGFDCSTAVPFCTGSAFTYPAAVNVPDLGMTGCLGSTPNAAWFCCQIDQTGPVSIFIQSLNGVDVDFICWGPFQSLSQACGSNLMANSGIDCSYSTSATETCDIPNGQTGQVYVMLITNYANIAGDITFSQTGGTGTLNCNFIIPQIVFSDHNISVCSNPAIISALPGYDHYLWSTGDTTETTTITTSGSYYITATLNGITREDTIHINLTSPYLNLNLSNDTTICGNATLTLDAGSGFASYLWNNGSANQAILVNTSGMYHVQASDTGNCVYNDSTKVIINPGQSLNIGNDTSLCNYHPLTLDAGVAFDTYQWSTGATTQTINVSTTGVYYVSATNIQCAATAFDTISCIFYAVPVANAGADDTICSGTVAVLSGSSGNAYLWEPSTGLSCFNCAVTNASPVYTTTYTFYVENGAGCISYDFVTINVSTANITSSNASCGLANGSATAHGVGGSGNYSYAWNTSPMQLTQTINNLAPGTYSVTVTDNILSCYIVKTVTISNVSVITAQIANIANATCGTNNGSITTTLTGGIAPFTYLWNTTPAQTSSTLSNVPAGYYCLTVTDAHNCHANICDSVRTVAFSAPEICIVTVDTATNYNMIVWEKSVTTGINQYNIYRETNITGVYNLIGSQNYNLFSTFIDNTSNSQQQPYRYKFAIGDACGFTSDQSAYHQTVHLTINAGMSGAWNLNWNNYEGFSFSSYNIYRGISHGNMAFFNSVASNVNSFTDLTPPPGIVYYMIEVVRPTACNPSAKAYYSTISNIAASSDIGINEYGNNWDIHLYPEPAKETLTLELTAGLSAPDGLEICDLLGRKIMAQSITNLTTQIDVSQLTSGMYLLRLKGGSKTQSTRFVKE